MKLLIAVILGVLAFTVNNINAKPNPEPLIITKLVNAGLNLGVNIANRTVIAAQNVVTTVAGATFGLAQSALQITSSVINTVDSVVNTITNKALQTAVNVFQAKLKLLKSPLDSIVSTIQTRLDEIELTRSNLIDQDISALTTWATQQVAATPTANQAEIEEATNAVVVDATTSYTECLASLVDPIQDLLTEGSTAVNETYTDISEGIDIVDECTGTTASISECSSKILSTAGKFVKATASLLKIQAKLATTSIKEAVSLPCIVTSKAKIAIAKRSVETKVKAYAAAAAATSTTETATTD